MINIVETARLNGPTQEAKGSEWDVTLIRGGFNIGRGRYYTAEALDSIVALANEKPIQCMANHMSTQEMRQRPEGDVRNVVGWFTNVRREGNEVKGTLNMLTDSASPYPHLPEAMKQSFQRGNPNFVELSIRGSAPAKSGTVEGVRTHIVPALTHLASVDLVTRGGAGGAISNLLASERDIYKGENMDLKELLTDVSSDDVKAAVAETHPDLFAVAESEEPEEIEEIIEEEEEMEDNTVLSEAQSMLEEARRERFKGQADHVISEAATSLPEKIVTRLYKRVEENSFKTLDEVKEAVDEEVEIYSELMKPRDIGLKPMAEMRSSSSNLYMKEMGPDEIYKALVATISGKSNYDGVRAFRSLQEAYARYQLTKGEVVNFFNGHDLATAIVREARAYEPLNFDPTINEAMAEGTFNIQESVVSTTFSVLLGTAMHKVFLDSYANAAARFNDHLRIMRDPIIVTDYKQYNFTRKGVYNSLPSVGEGGTYQPLTTPGEENVILQVVKYGGTEDLTLEAIANDDLNALQRIPRDLGLAAAVGRYRAVFDLFTANSGNGVQTDYDSTNLFAAGHNNRGTTALSSAELMIARNAMRAQTALSASEVNLFIEPRFILHPPELARLAGQLYTQDFEVDPDSAGTVTPGVGSSYNNMNPVKGFAEPIQVDYWTDSDNWYLVADPAEHETIRMALLEGHEDPMIIMQDDPSVGSVFSADKITFKVRDIRDQDVIDHRSFYGEIV